VFRRFVPDGAELGMPYLTLIVGSTFVERSDDVVAAWAADPSLTTLWRSNESLLGVFLGPKPRGVEEGLQLQFTLSADVRGPTVPVYFDFEGFWSQWTGLLPTLSYPQSAPGVGPHSAQTLDSLGLARKRSAVREINQGWRAAAPGDRPPRGEPPLPRRLRRLVESRHVQARVFPDLRKVPSPQGKPIEGLSLVHLRFRGGRRPEVFFRELVRRGVYPFLCVTDGGRAIIGTVSRPDEPYADRLQLDLSSEFGEEVGVARFPLRNLEVQVSHRYGGISVP